MDGTIYVKPERIRQYVIDLFGYYHVNKADAGMIADNLIDAEIRGVTTHGLTRIPLYTEKLISGLCDARAVPEIVRDYGATALIDAHDGLGQVAATKAMEPVFPSVSMPTSTRQNALFLRKSSANP